MRAAKLKVGYFAQHQLDELDPDGTPLTAMAAKMPRRFEKEVRARLGFFGFGVDKADTKISSLSGGEKARLLLALAAFDGPQLMVLDEPTNHLDIEAREALVEAINAYDGAVILISHDRHLIETCADGLWLVADGRVTPFDGDMDDYEALVLGRAAKKAEAEKPAPAATKVEQRKAAADRRAELAPLKKRADQAEREFAKLSADLGRVEVALADPALYAKDPKAVTELTRKRGELQRLIAAVEADWLDALEAYESAKSDAA